MFFFFSQFNLFCFLEYAGMATLDEEAFLLAAERAALEKELAGVAQEVEITLFLFVNLIFVNFYDCDSEMPCRLHCDKTQAHH